MKKLILSLVALSAISFNAGAQTWKMFVNHQDGTVDTIKTSAVKNVTFAPEDQNADQVIIKELLMAVAQRMMAVATSRMIRDSCSITTAARRLW